MSSLNISCYAEFGRDAEDMRPFAAAAAAAEALAVAEATALNSTATSVGANTTLAVDLNSSTLSPPPETESPPPSVLDPTPNIHTVYPY